MPIEVVGLEEYIELLQITEKQTERICGRSIYPGAKIVAQECKKRLMALKTDDSYFKRKAGYRHSITTRQKQGLIESMGIAKMLHRANVFDVKLGFDGYNDIVSSKYPKGQPNAMIARSLNKGTATLEAQPFMDMTIEASKEKAEKAIEEQFDKELEKIWSRPTKG